MEEEDYYDGEVDWVEVIWLDGTDEWALCYGEELFEDGFKTEKEAQERLESLEELLLKCDTQIKDILNSDDKFRYQMLSRMKMDCDYYLGYGNRNSKQLWAGDEKEQITIMKAIWKSFSNDGKPEWLTWDNILDYEKRMTNSEGVL